jgi:hypothetical protein
MEKHLNFTLIVFFFAVIVCTISFGQNSQENYLGIEPPGLTAKIFMPGLVSTGLSTRDMAITPDGKEIYFTVHGTTYQFSVILCSRYINGQWQKPEVAPFAANAKFAYTEPCISPDGSKIYFVSNRSKTPAGEKGSYDIWVADRIDGRWSEPRNIDEPINSLADEYFPSLTSTGTIYFTREMPDRSNAIFRSKFIDGKFAEPEKLPEQINFGADRFNAFIDPEEKYLIVSVFRAKDGKGAADYYIVFRNTDDTWQTPVNMGEKVNSQFNEYSPYVTRDGKYFFFMSSKPDETLFKKQENFNYDWLQEIHNSPGNGNNTMYWIDARIIDELRTDSSTKE